ncbi:YkgJ family cysteine cluster protein [bacterium]|nr:YkgJ family cysteine cluster protein [bacterium]
MLKKIKKFIYKTILRRQYYRTGQCNRCGDCCKRIYVRHKKDVIKDEKEFEKLRRLHPFYLGLEIVEKDDNGLVFRCTNFDEENRICKIHSKRYAICRKYPDEIILKMKAVMSEKCGYKFTPIESFEEVMKKMRKK